MGKDRKVGAILLNIVIVILSFFPILKVEGKNYYLLTMAAKGVPISPELSGFFSMISIWSIVMLLFCLVSVFYLYCLFTKRTVHGLEELLLGAATAGVIPAYAVLYVMLMAFGMDANFFFQPYFFIRSILIGIGYFGGRYAEENAQADKKGTKAPEKAESSRIFSIVVSFLIFLCALFVKWLTYEGNYYTIPEFIMTFKHGNGLPDSMMIGYVFSVFPLLAGIASGIRAMLLLFGRPGGIAAGVVRWLSFIYVAGMLIFLFYTPYIGAILALPMVLIEVLGVLYLEEYKEVNRREKERKQRGREAKAERRRRLDFPGKYSKRLYRIIWKNFRSSWKEYLLFIMSGVATSAFLFILFGLQSVLSATHSQEDFLSGTGMLATLREILPIVILLALFLLIFILSYYIKTKLYDYGMMISLGIRKSTLVFMIGAEYVGSIVSALVVGLAAGNILLYILKKLFLTQLSGGAPLVESYGKTYALTIFLFIGIVLVATLANYEMAVGFSISSSAVKSRESEKRPKKYLLPGFFLGVIFAGLGLYRFADSRWGEGLLCQFLFLAGSLMVFYFGIAKGLCIFLKKKSRVQRRLWWILPWRHRFRTHFKQWYLLFAVQILLLSVFLPNLSSSFVAQPVEALFPYDFVCMANEEDELNFTDMQSYPMVRITTVQGRESTWIDAFSNQFMSTIWPQGQHVGISEATYYELKKAIENKEAEPLNLKGEEIHVVYQQDASVEAHPLDWYMREKTPFFKIGQPLDQYHFVQREHLYPPHQVKSEETKILTGMFHRGEQENLVVFSDTYFGEIYKENKEGPSSLTLLQVPEEKHEETEAKLRQFQKKHEADTVWDKTIKPYYAKEEAMSDVMAERYMSKIANGAAMLMLLLCVMFFFYIKFAVSKSEIKAQDTFLTCMGMREKERTGLIVREINFYVYSTFIAAVLASLFFWIAKAILRMYDMTLCLKYAVGIGIMTAGCLLVAVIGSRLFGIYYVRTVRKNKE